MQVTSRLFRNGSGLLVELSKPETLNALDLDAFKALQQVLDSAEADSRIAFVVLWAPTTINAKAFCAGGDVRRLYEDFHRTGSIDPCCRFFQTEYLVDQRIWKFSKPVVALTHGITMGGGIGLIRGATIRVACETSVWAMPEISIGLYPDVGSTYFLSKLPPTWAAFIALTGARLGLSDLLTLGLATHGCPQSALPEIITDLETLPIVRPIASQELEKTLLRVIQKHTLETSKRSWREDWPIIESIFKNVVGTSLPPRQVVSRLWEDAKNALSLPACSPELRSALETFLSGSPLSACLITEQLNQKLALEESFQWEYQASINCMKNGDFFEGVRSRLIDKDYREPGKPKWQFSNPDLIPDQKLSELFPIKMQKQAVIELIKSHLQEELAALRAGNLISSQPSQELQATERALLMYRFLPVRSFTPEDVIAPGCLAELELSGRTFWILLVPQNGGLVTQYQGKPIQVLTPQSPLGEAMLGKKKGESFTVQSASGPRNYRVVTVL